MIPESVKMLCRMISMMYPDMKVTVDSPLNTHGEYWIDVSDGNIVRSITSWQSGEFGMYDEIFDGVVFGEKPNRTTADVEIAFGEISSAIEKTR